MKKNLLMLSGGVIFSVLAHVSPACAQWPTLDLGEVFNTIQSTISQVQSQIATTMETYSIANIQQAIGDKLGGLQKIKDAQEKIKKAQEKIEKAKKRAEKVIELKKKYEQAAKDAINDVKNAYDSAQSYVENTKNQVEGAIGNVKNQVENAKSQVEGAVNNVKNQVENAKSQVEGAVGNVKNQVENAKSQVEGAVGNLKNQSNDLFGSSEDNFDFENTTQNTGGNNAARTNNSGYSASSVEVEWGDGSGNTGFGFAEESTLGAQSGGGFSFAEENSADEPSTGAFKRFETNDADNQYDRQNAAQAEEDILIEWGNTEEVGENADLEDTGDKALLIKIRNDENNQMELMENDEDEALSAGRTKVKAFGKVSFNYNSKAGYAAQAGGFKTGTDDDSNFYFPDAFATWADLNFDDTADEEKLWAAIDKICEDLQSTENHETAEIDKKFDYDVVGVMRANAQAHSAVIENEAENGKTVEDLSDMVSVAGGTTLTQDSGMGEIGNGQIHQNRQDIVRLSDEAMSRFFDEVRKYCYHWPEVEE